ncbi:MAG TPA: ADP-ribosyl-[dinitrogen reductase] hydrolase [Anaeromyxobacteraceae bacterium]|nr:ADP-ribosyl-[dinitrogen reductase] hydrolase [Anaeromyxobacteraceae bacterium]
MADRAPDLDQVRARARAAFLGLALGDALGATVEFMTAAEIRAAHGVHRELTGGGWLHLKPGRVTDDTEMSVRLARAVDRAGGFDLAAVADELAAWLKTNPVDVGNTVRKGLRSYIVHGQLETPYNEWDAGNGGAMRMLPVALLSLGDEPLLERCALAQARLTHHHPLSDAACGALGRMVQRAVRGEPLPALREEADRLVALHPTFRFEPYRGLASGYVVDTLQTVFHHLFATGSFEDCLVATVNQGGDADTTGAIAGMLAGALYGQEGLPRRWLRRLDAGLKEELGRLADRLVALSPLARAHRG